MPQLQTSDDTGMKLETVAKLDKRKKKNVKKIWIVIFLIYSQFGAIRKPDSGSIVCKTSVFINSNLLSYKKWKQN